MYSLNIFSVLCANLVPFYAHLPANKKSSFLDGSTFQTLLKVLLLRAVPCERKGLVGKVTKLHEKIKCFFGFIVSSYFQERLP